MSARNREKRKINPFSRKNKDILDLRFRYLLYKEQEITMQRLKRSTRMNREAARLLKRRGKPTYIT